MNEHRLVAASIQYKLTTNDIKAVLASHLGVPVEAVNIDWNIKYTKETTWTAAKCSFRQMIVTVDNTAPVDV